MELEDRKRLVRKSITEMHRITQADCSAFVDAEPAEFRPLRERLLELRLVAVHAFMERHRLQVQLNAQISRHAARAELTRLVLDEKEERCDELVLEICDLEDEMRTAACELEAKGYSLAIRSEVMEIILEREEEILQLRLTRRLPRFSDSVKSDSEGEDTEPGFVDVLALTDISAYIKRGCDAIRAKYAERLAVWKNYR